MCGIAGIVNFNGAPVETQILQDMTRVLARRGPDGEGYYIDGTVGLGHRRLAIIDVAGGRQPLRDAEHDHTLIYNGEIYNYKELRAELSGQFHFETDGDTEVLLRAYQKWGIDCLHRLRGMFAFALYDGHAQRIVFARDRLGIKPLYYAHDADRFLFGSQLTALMCHPGFKRDVDPRAIESYLYYQYVPTPQTIYRSARKLEAGHYLALDVTTGAVKHVRYWQPVLQPDRRDEPEIVDDLTALLRETIKIYVRSDVPFGAFLSGGVDSSIVAALMAEVMPEPVKTFSIGYREAAHSELPYAVQAHRTIGSQHFPEICEALDSPERLDQLAFYYGEPFGDSSALPTLAVSRLAARHVKMVLSGDGGDELFGGYESYAALLKRHIRRLPGPLSGMLRFAERHVGGRPGRWLGRHLQDLSDVQAERRYVFSRPQVAEFRGESSADPRVAIPGIGGITDPVGHYQYEDLVSYLPDDILAKVDRASMAHSLEVRVPLLDHKVVEFALSLPLRMRLRFGPSGSLVQKYALKRVGKTWYDDAFLNRPKMGFGVPAESWLKGPLRPLVFDKFKAGKGGLFEWLAADRVAPWVIGQYDRGNREFASPQVYVLLMLAIWFDRVHPASRAELLASAQVHEGGTT